MLFLIVQALDYNDREGGEILGDNKQVDRMIHATQNKDRRIWKKFGGKNYNIGAIISLIIIALIWFFAAHAVNSPFIFPWKMYYIRSYTHLQICTFWKTWELRCAAL